MSRGEKHDIQTICYTSHMIYQKKPKDFHPQFEVVGCFVEYNGKILLLQRQDHKPQGNTWGMPAGKKDTSEDPLATVMREITEETGLHIPKEKFQYLGMFYTRYPDYDFVYHLFATKLTTEETITINPSEHKNFLWATPKNALSMNLIEDFDAYINLYY
jgi:8-oxo-dGTP pyrophosphatase MutT (NUDIX family)